MNTAAEKLKLEANELFKKQDYDSASLLYNKAIKEAPNAVVLYSNRSLTYLKMNRPDLALEDAEKVIELEPSYVKGYYHRASAYVALRKFDLAKKDYENVASISPDDKLVKKKIQMCHSVIHRNKLPDEMIAKILRHTISGSENRHAQFTKVRSVCKKWSSIIDANKRDFKDELAIVIRGVMSKKSLRARTAELPLAKKLVDFFTPVKIVVQSGKKSGDNFARFIKAHKMHGRDNHYWHQSMIDFTKQCKKLNMKVGSLDIEDISDKVEGNRVENAFKFYSLFELMMPCDVFCGPGVPRKLLYRTVYPRVLTDMWGVNLTLVLDRELALEKEGSLFSLVRFGKVRNVTLLRHAETKEYLEKEKYVLENVDQDISMYGGGTGKFCRFFDDHFPELRKNLSPCTSDEDGQSEGEGEYTGKLGIGQIQVSPGMTMMIDN